MSSLATSSLLQKNLSSVNNEMRELHAKCLGIDCKGAPVIAAPLFAAQRILISFIALNLVENRGAVRFQIRNFMHNVGVSPAMRKSLQSTPVLENIPVARRHARSNIRFLILPFRVIGRRPPVHAAGEGP